MLADILFWYLIATWFIRICWLIQDWDEVLAENYWMPYFPALAILAVILTILVAPFSVPEAYYQWLFCRSSDDEDHLDPSR